MTGPIPPAPPIKRGDRHWALDKRFVKQPGWVKRCGLVADGNPEMFAKSKGDDDG